MSALNCQSPPEKFLFPISLVPNIWADDISELLDTEMLLVLKGYFDESLQVPAGKTLAVAGYISHVNYWRKLTFEWNNILLRHGLKDGLHMKDFAGSTREFEKFEDDESKRREFLGSLVRTLYKEPRFVAVGCAVDIESFREIPKEKTAPFDSDPYLFAFAICARHAVDCDYVRPALNSMKLGVVFDRREEMQNRALSLFSRIKMNRDMDRLGDIAFSSRKESPPLQAADFCAYEVRKDLEAKLTGRGQRWGIKQIASGPSCGVVIFDSLGLKRFFHI